MSGFGTGQGGGFGTDTTGTGAFGGPSTDPAISAAPNSNLIATDIELANAARDAGFRDDRPPNDPEGRKHSELAWAVAIALAESHGDVTATRRINAPCGTYVVGAWQICGPLNKNLFNVKVNAQAAFGKFDARGHKFGGGLFSTFPTPASGNIARAEVAVRSTHRDRPGFTRLAGLGTLGDVLEQVGLALRFLTSGQTWIRFGEAIAGGVLILVAIVLLYKSSRGGG